MTRTNKNERRRRRRDEAAARPKTGRESTRYVGAKVRYVINEHVDLQTPGTYLTSQSQATNNFRTAVRTLLHYIVTKTSLQPADFDTVNGLDALTAMLPLALVGNWRHGNELVGGGRDNDVIRKLFGNAWDEVARFAI